MKKHREFGGHFWLPQKLVRVMKLTCFLILAFALTVSASSYSQSSKLSLSLKKGSLIDVLSQIEDQSDYYFYYSKEELTDIDGLSAEIRGENINVILDRLLINTGLEYKIIDKYIVVKRASEGNSVVGQKTRIKGNVTDLLGAPLPGVTVFVKGTTQGTVSDSDGNYTLDDVVTDAILVFSFVGMQTQEIPVAGQTSIDVIMEEDAIGIEEVVAIGYGSVKKSDLTGSVNSIKAEDLRKEGASSINQLLQGASTGVQVVQNSSEPGGGLSIQIRGSGSINAGTAPLYVIDGMPIDNGSPVTGGGSGYDNQRTPRNPLSSLNPADVESIEILKDASATAIYGARGANGVIIITTKKGEAGELKVSYDGYVGIQGNVKKLDILNAEEYMSEMNAIQEAGGADATEHVSGIVNGGNDWQDLIYNNNAVIQSHNLSFSGGNDKTNFYASFSYFDQDGVIKSSGIKRYTGRVNLNYKASDKFNMGINVTSSYTFDDFNSGGFGTNEAAGVLYAALNWDPTSPAYFDDGSYYISDFINTDNPLALLYGEDAISNKYRTFGTVFGEYSLLPELKVRLNVGGDMHYQRKDVYIDKTTIDGYASSGIGTILQGHNSNYLVEGLATYEKQFDQHKLTALAGITAQKFIYEDVTTKAEGFVSDVTRTYNLSSGDPLLYGVGSGKSDNKLLSYLTRINYSYMGKYLLTASFRADGSSRFGANNKFGYFPSVALAWRVDQEDFIKNIEELSSLKLRLSWGQTGNQSIGNFQSLTTFSNGPLYVYDEELAKSQQPARFSNPDLKWETTEQIDIGIDFGLLDNRIYGTLDYFEKTTSDMLLNLPVPTTTGFNIKKTNIGSVKNSGFEFGLTTRNLVNKLKWTTSINMTTLKNEVLDLGGISEIITGGAGWASQISIIKEGEPVYSFYGYEIEGIWQTGDDFSVTTDNVSPGDIKYKDQNGDQTINADDRTILGNSIPKLIWSMNNNLSYKGFSLDILLEGVHGVNMFNNNLAETYFPISFRRNRYAEPILNRWTPENPSDEFPSFVDPLGQGQKYVNSYTVEDASYIKLKSVKLSYNINARNLFFDSATVFVSGENLALFTNYKGLDPSLNPNGSADFRIDFNAYPSSTTTMLGVSLNF
ncbi:SusC/RagA family TonB-linked outer membrane protein [Sunxiuqinia sp. A32]|uniref:SusC/RagA family TonB-linked outer membrane protein n=1 Tax=Sunxiuqinia sp. A32 TaxID=3461496 RepID=UPI0040458BD4